MLPPMPTREDHQLVPPVVSPWQPAHMTFMASRVPGFEDYAPQQRYVRTQDLVFWAQAGSDGAGRRRRATGRAATRCRSLRTALIGAKVCEKISVARQWRTSSTYRASASPARPSASTITISPPTTREKSSRCPIKVSLPPSASRARGGSLSSTWRSSLTTKICRGPLLPTRARRAFVGTSPRCGRCGSGTSLATWRIYALAVCHVCMHQAAAARDQRAYPSHRARHRREGLQQMVDVWKIPLDQARDDHPLLRRLPLHLHVGFASYPCAARYKHPLRRHRVAPNDDARGRLPLLTQPYASGSPTGSAVLFACALFLLFGGVRAPRDAHNATRTTRLALLPSLDYPAHRRALAQRLGERLVRSPSQIPTAPRR